ncbi:unnamed protein product [Coffea canephora]|uniref:Laccase n=1 Tax=Coffea canephora TaxID=49390 RepID=A0A068TY26_COFCA|nr:unnamed protein product [Coffea canephora]
MSPNSNSLILYFLACVLFSSFLQDSQAFHHFKFVVKEARYRRLCSSKEILTVNRKFPGPTLYAHRGDTVIVDVINKGSYNITLHWHGVKQPRNPWSDGPEYITQCPIRPGNRFRQKIIFSDEEGTLWWHAHNDFLRSTVHGAIIVYPRRGLPYPFPKPYAEVPIILGEWWKEDAMVVFEDFVRGGGQPKVSDAYTINGRPGDFYPCSKRGKFKLKATYGKSYLLRIINAALDEILFFGIAKHKLTVVGTDASYTKPLTRDFITISPGQTLDCLLFADQKPDHYYMAARPYVSGINVTFNNTTTTGMVKYRGAGLHGRFSSSPPLIPYLPCFNDTSAAVNFSGSLKSLASKDYPVDVPLTVKKRFMSTVSVNTFPCPNKTCDGPNGTRLAASMNNITFVTPSFDVLEAYYYGIRGVFGKNFPDRPPFVFNYTADYLPLELQRSKRGTEVKTIKYNSSVEIILQGTKLVAGIDHPMHLHGYSYYVVGWGLGNFNESKDPMNYNLVDPPRRNTIAVPKNGWTTIRFRADNPGVWLLHCHLERHIIWGMSTVLIVRDGKKPEERILPPPQDMPAC